MEYYVMSVLSFMSIIFLKIEDNWQERIFYNYHDIRIGGRW